MVRFDQEISSTNVSEWKLLQQSAYLIAVAGLADTECLTRDHADRSVTFHCAISRHRNGAPFFERICDDPGLEPFPAIHRLEAPVLFL